MLGEDTSVSGENTYAVGKDTIVFGEDTCVPGEDTFMFGEGTFGKAFLCKDHKIDVETGLYFGKKNSFVENQNIFISGLTQDEDQEIIWEIIKI